MWHLYGRGASWPLLRTAAEAVFCCLGAVGAGAMVMMVMFISLSLIISVVLARDKRELAAE